MAEVKLQPAAPCRTYSLWQGVGNALARLWPASQACWHPLASQVRSGNV